MEMKGPSAITRQWCRASAAPAELGLCVVLLDGWDPVLAYRTNGEWYESPHDPLPGVTAYLELAVDEVIREFG